MSIILPTIEDFEKLKTLSHDELIKRGLAKWDKNLYLFPARWYNDIPDGFEVVDINFEKEKFIRNVTDDDQRFGYLAYGILRD